MCSLGTKKIELVVIVLEESRLRPFKNEGKVRHDYLLCTS